MIYEEFLEKMNEGVEYANTIKAENLEPREFQRKIADWLEVNIPSENLVKIIADDPSKKIDILIKILALSGVKY